MAKKNFAEKSGSAMILVVVLTSLLSILAVMFMLSSRVDKITASAISGNKELDYGVDSVVAKISQQLVEDVNFPYEEYYDYPDANNPWLANLEPYDNGGYKWRHISDIYNQLGGAAYNLQASICDEYQTVISAGIVADADGDGVSDSVWVELPDVNSSKGKPVYAAVRVIDNGAMLNVNTAYLFDPNETNRSRIDGSTQTQINLAALSQRGDNGIPLDAATKLQVWRSGSAATDITSYEQNVVWNYGQQFGTYTPFDISDELKLRNRYILNYNIMTSRIEELWTWAYDGGLKVPRDSSTGVNGANWVYRVNNISPDPCDYDYRHISTTYNVDRMIAPDGAIMVNANAIADINAANVLYDRLRRCIDPCVSDVDFNRYSAQLAQIAANINDSSDGDANVTIIYDRDRLGVLHEPHYGFERPCIFISELVYKLVKITDPFLPSGYQTNWSYGIELSKLYPGANGDNWQLLIGSTSYPLPPDFTSSANKYYVKLFDDPNASLLSTVNFDDSPEDGETDVSPNVILGWPLSWMPGVTSCDVYFGTDYSNVTDANNNSVMWPEFKGNQPVTSNFYDPVGSLNQETYYWRIDDLDASGSVVAKGDVWSFAVGNPEPNVISLSPGQIIFDANSIISLQREVNGHWLTVDSVAVPAGLVEEPNVANTWVRSFQRDMTVQRWIKRLWSPVIELALGQSTLGNHNDFNNPGAGSMQARPAPFDNTGDLAMVFSKSTYYDTAAGQSTLYAVGYNNETEEVVRIDLRDPNFQRIFQYVSVFGHADSNGRVKGRININTAPWYVIAQLPWVSQRREVPSDYDPSALAQAIVAYRDKLNLGSPAKPDYYHGGDYDSRHQETGITGLREEPGFNSIAELAMVVDKNINTTTDILMNYYDMRYYVLGGRQNIPQMGFPDLTFNERTGHDDAPGDMEKRYLVFSRISDLVTVRSDVFTAYVLVRVGNNGPQKRVIAILDRSEVTPGGSGKVKVIAVHPVPDPR
ncbi:MAG: hypothetical protein NTW55_00595 [Planctomycetota bacterium]|nr:hypothetical protein [Planctomycetota bacterium]